MRVGVSCKSIAVVGGSSACNDFEGLTGGRKRFVLISERDVEGLFMRRLRQG